MKVRILRNNRGGDYEITEYNTEVCAIEIELTDKEKEQIVNMPDENYRYCKWANPRYTQEEIIAFMQGSMKGVEGFTKCSIRQVGGFYSYKGKDGNVMVESDLPKKEKELYEEKVIEEK